MGKATNITITDSAGKQIANLPIKKKQTIRQAMNAWKKRVKQAVIELQKKTQE